MARTPTFIREFVPYSTVKQNELKWSSYAASRISYNRNLLAREFGVDPDKVYSIFARNFKKHTKDFPLAAVDTGSEKNNRDYEKQEQYVLFLWQYYVVDKPKKPSLPKEPKETTVQKPKVEDSYDEQEIDPDNPYAGDVDDPPMIAEMGRAKPKKGGALKKPKATVSKTYVPAGPSKDDLLGDAAEEIDPRIAELLGLQDGFDFSYDDYLTMLKEWQVAARMTDSKVSTEDSMLIDEERKRVRGKTGKFKVNVKSVNKPTAKPATRPTAGMVGGPPQQPQLLLAPGEDGKKKRKRKASLEENVAAIRKSVDKIFKVLNGQFEAIKKQAELDRRNKQKEKRKKRENALEGAGKFMLNQARKLAAPTFDLLDRLFKFIGTILLGRVMIKLLEWLSDPENKEKVESLGRFLEDWWPVLLSAFVLFATPLGALIRSVLAGVVKLSMFMAKKAIPGLLRFAKAHPLAAAATVIVGGAAVGGIMQSQTQSNDPERAKEGKTQLDDTLEFGGATGDPMSALMFRGGGQVPRYSKGGGVQRNRRTMPSGGKVTHSTGKRVKGAGKDTQMIVAQPGEIVMSKPAVDKIGAPFLLGLNKMGGGTNQPTYSKFGDIEFAQGGGQIGVDINDNLNNLSVKELVKLLDPTEPGARRPHVFRAAREARQMYADAPREEKDRQVLIATIRAARSPEPSQSFRPLLSSSTPRREERTGNSVAGAMTGRRPSPPPPSPQMQTEEGGSESEMGPQGPSNILSSSAGAAPLTGVIPQLQKPPSATPKPPPAMLGKGNLPPAPEAPTPQVSVMASANTVDTGGKRAPGSTGARDLPTDFQAFYQTELRLQMLAIYGITEVE